jgi:transcriptional regulator with XRE-family HTH domain
MVNIEEFAKRLKSIMEYYEISAALLAEKIDIQRSSISHLLSGRNKPSLDFVLKILKEFPDVELYWLLNGVGKFPKQNNSNPTPTLFETKVKESKEIVQNEIIAPSKTSIENSGEIERIVIFYKDGSFKNYLP